MIHAKYVALRAWLDAHSHVHLREWTTKIGATMLPICAAVAELVPTYAPMIPRLAMVGAVCSFVLIMVRHHDQPTA